MQITPTSLPLHFSELGTKQARSSEKISAQGSKIKDILIDGDEQIRGKCIFERKESEADRIKTVFKRGNTLLFF